MPENKNGLARRCTAVLAFCACLSLGSAHADDSSTRANRMAYEASILCFIADGIVAGDEHRAGNSSRQAALEAKAREAFDIALKAGDALGYSGTRINEDFGLAQSSEANRLVSDATYFRQTASRCKQLDLM